MYCTVVAIHLLIQQETEQSNFEGAHFKFSQINHAFFWNVSFLAQFVLDRKVKMAVNYCMVGNKILSINNSYIIRTRRSEYKIEYMAMWMS